MNKKAVLAIAVTVATLGLATILSMATVLIPKAQAVDDIGIPPGIHKNKFESCSAIDGTAFIASSGADEHSVLGGPCD